MSLYPFPGYPLAPLVAPTPILLTDVYCTDEDIAVRCTGDYAELVPDHQLIVSGGDGVLAVGSPWQLQSPTGSFVTRGCQPNQVVYLEPNATNSFGPDGDLYAIAAVGPTALTLRRIGLAAGIGQPPVVTSIVNNVNFSVRTFGPQIESASYELNQKFRIDPASEFWNQCNIYDQRQLQQACVLMVLYRQYTSETRSKDSDWSAKTALAKTDLTEAMEHLSLKWGYRGQADLPIQRNSGRLVR